MADKHTIIKGARLQLSSDAERLGPTSKGESWDSYRRWLAQMITGQRPNTDMTPYDPQRFAG